LIYDRVKLKFRVEVNKFAIKDEVLMKFDSEWYIMENINTIRSNSHLLRISASSIENRTDDVT